MNAILPRPVISAALLLIWLLLNQSLSAGHLVLGALLGLVAGRLMAHLEPERTRIGSLRAIMRLLGIVVRDVVRSNIAVAQIVLGPRRKDITSGFVEIPLALRSQAGLAALACIITATPGTLWVDHDPVRNIVTIHVLDLIDERAWIDLIKNRYERRLLEIFP